MAEGHSSSSNVQLPAPSFRPELGTQRFQGPFVYDHDYINVRESAATISSVIETLQECKDYGMELVMDMEECLCEKDLFCPEKKEGGVLALEQSLLDLSASPDVVQGLFYMLPLYYDDKLFIRYMESGYCKGFFPTALEVLKKKYPNVPRVNILPWTVYTDKDVKMFAAKSSKNTDPTRQYTRKLGCDNSKQSNKGSVMAQIKLLKDKLEELHGIVFVHKNKPNLRISSHRFFYCSTKWDDNIQLIDEKLSNYLHNPSPPEEVEKLLSHVTSMPTRSKKEQFLLLSKISNYHWITNPGISSKKFVKEDTTRFCNHIVYFKPGDTERRKYLPTSPRNRLIHFIASPEEFYDSNIYDLVKHILDLDNPSEVEGVNEEEPEQPPRKRRRAATKIVTVTPKAVFDSVGANLDEDLNSAQSRTQYTTFQEDLLSQGIIKWRYHQDDKDICVMTNIHPSSGFLLPSSFAHVTCISPDGDEMILKCTCEIYNMIKRADKQDIPLLPDVDEVLDKSFTCMHCRFYRDHLSNAYQHLMEQNTNLTRALQMVQSSLQYINDPIQLLGHIVPQGTTKFSVKGEDSYSIVNFSFHMNKCYAKCMDGICQAKMTNKKKIPKKLSLREHSKLCSHLTTVFEHFDYIKGFFRSYFNDDIPEDPENAELCQQPARDEVNTDDVNITQGVTGNFDIASGLWTFKSLSDHKPLEQMDPQLVQHTGERNGVICPTNLNEGSGIYEAIELKPRREGRMCNCGAGYDLGTYTMKGTATLYTRNGAAQLKTFNLNCNSGQCEINFDCAAQEQGIFFYSSFTAAGDEIAWDFISLVKRSKMSFSGFCSHMTRIYQTTSVMSIPFMGGNTFIKFFFGWLSAFKIDFRKEVDPWCKHSPKVLACDGTHIGVAVRNMLLDNPITATDDKDTMRLTQHKRYDRVLLPDRKSRLHLRYLSKKHIKKLKPEEVLEPLVDHTNRTYLKECVTRMGNAPVTAFIEAFTEESEDQEVITGMAKLMYLLSGDAAMSSVAPFASHPIIHRCIIDVQRGHINKQNLEDLKAYSVEIADLLVLSVKHECVDMITSFIEYIVLKIELIHQMDPVPDVEEIEGSYNPPSGVAYYFTESGAQQRKMPYYELDSSNRRGNYDDQPQVDDRCNKLFPNVSFGGFGYMFLWFCPIHGHSYGFHLISGGEGRKDPFSSIVKYMENPPEEIFYDFACQLEEYCLNREPGLFKNTRFWHDLFHSITHKCGINYKSGRVQGLEGINSEICEQVNSYLQCVKYTGSHLSQEHFVFFVQFFLYLMNKDKTKTFQKQAEIAYKGKM